MGVDYYNCGICNEIFCDAGEYWYCGNCEGFICENCYPAQKKKYKVSKKDDEISDNYGVGTPLACDECSPKNKANKIKKLEAELIELKK